MLQTVLLLFCTEALPKVWVQNAKDLVEKPQPPSIPVSVGVCVGVSAK